MPTRDRRDEPDIVRQIRQHEHAVRQGTDKCDLRQCPRCGCPRNGPDFFRRHAARKRTFWVLCGNLVEKVLSAVTRWRCRLCRLTFTGYPSFALPYKRYTAPDVVRLSRRYVQEDELSYREAVEHDGRPIFHARNDADEIADDSTEGEEEQGSETVPVLAHTTVYRWIGGLGRLVGATRAAVDLIQQKDPSNGLVRRLAAVRIAARKSRSEARKRVLLACANLCLVLPVYVGCFGERFFTEFATLRSGARVRMASDEGKSEVQDEREGREPRVVLVQSAGSGPVR